MARLPSALDLSGPDSFRSGRQIAEYDTSAAGRGLASMGADIASVASEQVQKQKQQQNAVDIARAEAEKTKGLLGAQDEFDQDPDYTTFARRAPEKTGEVVNKAGDLIRDPKMRERWKAGAQSDAARTNDTIFDWGTKKRVDAETVAFDDALEINRRIYVDPNTSEDAKKKAKGDIEGAIQQGLSTGLLDPKAADARRKVFIDDAEFSRGKLAVEQNPDIISKPRGPVAAIIQGAAQKYGVNPAIALGIAQIESGLNPNAKAGTSSAGGLFQFIDGTANQYGLKNKFDAAENADAGARLTRDNTAGLQRDLGREPTPGEVYLAHFGGYGVAEKLGKADPSAPTSSIFSPNAIRANAFILAGKTAGEVRDWADRKMAAAIHAAGAGENPDWYKAISPEQRAAVDNVADTARNQRNAELRAQIDVAATNAPPAMLNTGAYTGTLPTADQFMQAYGPQEGATRYDSFVASLQTGKQAYDMRTMPAADIQTVLNEAKPTSSGDDAALQQERYSTLSRAAETTLKAREDDPALYVRKAFPSIDNAWNNVTKESDYQSAIAASVAAQQQLGITDVKPLPKEIAATAVKSFKDEAAPEQQRIAAATNVLMATPDKGQRQALFEQLVDAGLPDLTEGAFEALARGDQGAADRLFRAAMTDPSKLPGKSPETPANIDQAIQDKLMAEGEIGDVYYGLSNGSAENLVRAERGSKLLTNAVNLRLRNGETLDAAVAGVSKDLYGDLQVVVKGDGRVNAQILLPSKDDPQPVLDGLDALQPQVRGAIEAALAVPADAKTSDGTKAILDATTQNYADRVMAEGYFRNGDGGYVFIDPFIGTAIADAAGKPIIFKPDLTIRSTSADQFERRTPAAGAGPSVDENGNPVVYRP